MYSIFFLGFKISVLSSLYEKKIKRNLNLFQKNLNFPALIVSGRCSCLQIEGICKKMPASQQVQAAPGSQNGFN